MAYSQDLRERVLAFVAEGKSKEAAAERYQIGCSTVYLWCQTPEKHQADKPGPKGSWKLDMAELEQRVAAKPDSYQRELAKALGVTQPRICQSLKQLRLSRKKNDAVSRKKRRISQDISGDSSHVTRRERGLRG